MESTIKLTETSIGKTYRTACGRPVLITKDADDTFRGTFQDGDRDHWWYTNDGIAHLGKRTYRLVEEVGSTASPASFHAGKYYRTRDGRKAFVAAVMEPDPFKGGLPDYPVRGYIQNEGSEAWDSDGRAIIGEESHRDLVTEWHDERKGVGYLNVYADRLGNGVSYEDASSRFTADEKARINRRKRLACVEVNWTEGEGL